MTHKTHEQIEDEIARAKKSVVIGGVYSHYKHPGNLYKVIDLATQEATDTLCVVYRAEYGKKLTFVRDLENWLETSELNGIDMPRFTLVTN